MVAKKKFRVFLFTLIGLGLLFGFFILKTLRDAGYFKTIQPHFAGKIAPLKAQVGTEDLTIAQALGLALISCDDRKAKIKQPNATNLPEGNIYSLDLKTASALPKPLVLVRPQAPPFHPHGISLVQNKDGAYFLWVINHTETPEKGKEHRIELYAWDKADSLKLMKTYTDPAWLRSPNDIVGLDEQRFYFTNDHGYTTRFWRSMEDYLQLAVSDVVYFDGQRYAKALSGLTYPNGINISTDQQTVFVALTTPRKVLICQRQPSTGQLLIQEEIFVDTGVDNIEIDPEGNLWVGCHPKLLAFVTHAQSTAQRKLSPSQVIKIYKNKAGNYTYDEVFLNDGTSLSGSSVGAVYQKKLLIGSVFEDLLLGEMQ